MPYEPMKSDPQPISVTASKPVSAPRTASGTGSGPDAETRFETAANTAAETGFKLRSVPEFSFAIRCLLTGLALSFCIAFQGAAQHTVQNVPNPESLADTAILRINSTDGSANHLPGGENTAISDGEVSRFGRLLVQTPQGRIEPVDTYASELLRKLHHRDHYGRLTATEWLLGVLADPDRWSREPFIYLPDKNVRTLLAGAQAPRTDGTHLDTGSATCRTSQPAAGKYAALHDFFDPQGGYRLADAVEKAYAKTPGARDKRDKELLKADEKVNILYGLLAGRMLAMFPTPLRWYSPGDDLSGLAREDSLLIAKILPAYSAALAGGTPPGERAELLGMIETFQQARGAGMLPSPARISAEIFYNRADIFRTAFRAYLLLGFLLLVVAISGSTRRKKALLQTTSKCRRWLPSLLTVLIVAVFLWQSAGLGLRWYISGRAPWTNAYESMVYVGWTTVLAGLIFARRSRLALALATLMGGVILFVSNLNWLDPQITPLVPVLKSYWLMIHVSVITASYGFFGIAAVTGLASLIAIIAGRPRHDLRIIGELSMLIGLVLLAAGIFLGAVWANESWGRYWGWDPKETWALITLLVYTFVTHSRHIPRLNNDYAFSAMSLAAIASVLMTFFGVNYYLSGLHSYGGSGEVAFAPAAAGTAIAAVLILWAGIRYRRLQR